MNVLNLHIIFLNSLGVFPLWGRFHSCLLLDLDITPLWPYEHLPEPWAHYKDPTDETERLPEFRSSSKKMLAFRVLSICVFTIVILFLYFVSDFLINLLFKFVFHTWPWVLSLSDCHCPTDSCKLRQPGVRPGRPTQARRCMLWPSEACRNLRRRPRPPSLEVDGQQRDIGWGWWNPSILHRLTFLPRVWIMRKRCFEDEFLFYNQLN